MKDRATISGILTLLIALIWLTNGLFCKLLHFVPRHEQIVSAILGPNYATLFTKLIGIAEILMAIWILSGYKRRINAIVQIVIIAAMNTLEAILVPHLLLFGRFNAVLATVLILVIYANEFLMNKEAT